MEKELLEHNMRLLEVELLVAGMPEKAVEQLRSKVMEDKEETLSVPYATAIDRWPVNGELYFERGHDKDPYRLMSFTVDLGNSPRALMTENAFLRGGVYDTSLRQAVNLMHGNYVYKEPALDLEKKGFWVSLDIASTLQGYWHGLSLTQKKGNYARLDYFRHPFRVEEGIAKSGLDKFLGRGELTELAQSLKNGNQPELALERNGLSEKVRAIAVPYFDKIQLIDNRGRVVQLLNQEERLAQSRSKGQKHGRSPH